MHTCVRSRPRVAARARVNRVSRTARLPTVARASRLSRSAGFATCEPRGAMCQQTRCLSTSVRPSATRTSSTTRRTARHKERPWRSVTTGGSSRRRVQRNGRFAALRAVRTTRFRCPRLRSTARRCSARPHARRAAARSQRYGQ